MASKKSTDKKGHGMRKVVQVMAIVKNQEEDSTIMVSETGDITNRNRVNLK